MSSPARGTATRKTAKAPSRAGSGRRRTAPARTKSARTKPARTKPAKGTRRGARAAAQARRSRVLVAAAALVAALVVATSFPFSSLLGQRSQLAAAQGQLTRLSDQNRALSAEVLRLGDPGTVAAIARADYGFVQPGQAAYDILPTAGAPLTSGANSGHVPLEGPPVAPGSVQSQTLLDAGAGAAAITGGSGSTSTGSGSAGHGGSVARTSGQGSGKQTGPGFWGRVLRTLEFWR